MNKRPVSYLQTDKRWKSLPYRVKGEDATIGGSGCGPTAAAMAIETITGKTFTPVDACKWSVDHGYKALNVGTYYSYFVPQFRAFGIECRQLLGSSLHNKPDHPIHDQVKQYWLTAMVGLPWTAHGVVCSGYLSMAKSDHRRGGITYEAARAAGFGQGSENSPPI